MQSTNWAPEHSDALREYLAKGMSFSEIAKAINAKFKHRLFAQRRDRPRQADGACRAGPAGSRCCPPSQPTRWSRLARFAPPKPGRAEFHRPLPVFETAEPVKLRCVEIEPRHLSLIELEPGDCRYPYGGDEEGEAITFCGHPRRAGSSYCTPHFHLTPRARTVTCRTGGRARHA